MSWIGKVSSEQADMSQCVITYNRMSKFVKNRYAQSMYALFSEV